MSGPSRGRDGTERKRMRFVRDHLSSGYLQTSSAKLGTVQVTWYEIATFIVPKGQIAVKFQHISSSSK